jgi:hypothetical protein
MPTPVNMMSHCQLLDNLVVYSCRQDLISELVKRLVKKNIKEGQIREIITEIKISVEGLNNTDTDLINENSLSMEFGQRYFAVREQILDILRNEKLVISQLALSVG